MYYDFYFCPISTIFSLPINYTFNQENKQLHSKNNSFKDKKSHVSSVKMIYFSSLNGTNELSQYSINNRNVFEYTLSQIFTHKTKAYAGGKTSFIMLHFKYIQLRFDATSSPTFIFSFYFRIPSPRVKNDYNLRHRV